MFITIIYTIKITTRVTIGNEVINVPNDRISKTIW